MNETIIKILLSIGVQQGDIPKALQQLQTEISKFAGVELPISFKPIGDAQIRSLLKRTREEFSLGGIKSPSQEQLLSGLEVQAMRAGLTEKFPVSEIRHGGERELALESARNAEKLAAQRENVEIQNLAILEKLAKQREQEEFQILQILERVATKREELEFRNLQIEERLAKQKEDRAFRTMQIEERIAKQKEAREFRSMQIQERIAKQREDRQFQAMQIQERLNTRQQREKERAEKSLVDEISTEAKMQRLPELEQAVANQRKYEFDPFSPENRAEMRSRAESRLQRIHGGDSTKVAEGLARFEERMNQRRMKSLEFLGKTAGQTNFQITATSNYLLAASSVLRPLSPMLSNLAMSAGFAAFSLGALPAALTGLAAALGGWVTLLKSASAEATKAGLATLEWKEATFQYNMTVRALMVTIGRDVQREFEPIVDLAEEFVDNLADVPWHEFIEGTANMAEVLMRASNAVSEFLGPLTDFAALWVKLGYGGDNKWSWLFGESKRTDADRPPYFGGNQFHIRDVRDVGRSIQESILKTTIEDQILAETVKGNEQRAETNRILREGLLYRVMHPYTKAAEDAYRIITAEGM